MTQLYRHFRIHQIFGANTDVGKTVLTTALCRVSASRKKQVFYLKPVSTGAPSEADDGHIHQFAASHNEALRANCLFRYSEPVSPHLAVQRDQKKIVSDEYLVKSIGDYIQQCAKSTSRDAVMYVETAGGVHSPVISGNTQVNAYRPLFLPVILIGDAKLGGISSTISAYESLLLRGYRVDAVAMFSNDYYQNHLYLKNYFEEQNIPLFSAPPPPSRDKNPENDRLHTITYYSEMTLKESTVYHMDEQLDKIHTHRIEELASMPRRTLDSIWWPFVQHGLIKNKSDIMVIDSATSDFFSTFNETMIPDSQSLLKPKFDGSASWWTQTIGHANPLLTLAAAKAAGRYGHVMFPQAIHEPALKLAEQLINGPGAGWASRVFFSDDGSTGMEVALKMAFRAFSKKTGWRKGIDPELGVIGIKGSYHGDTIGAMDACEEGIYTCEWHNSKGYWLEPPEVGFRDGKLLISLPPSMETLEGKSVLEFPSLSAVYNVNDRLHSPLAAHYHHFISKILTQLGHRRDSIIAALVLEPLVMGAGGMIFVDPLFQRVLVDTARSMDATRFFSSSMEWHGMPVIFDEVFVGLYRLGMKTCASVLGVSPDIAVYAKILTGGLVPMAVTLANDSIFQAFLGEVKTGALLHGHSYTAHPVGCQVALETLKRLEHLSANEKTWQVAKAKWNNGGFGMNVSSQSPTIWSLWDPGFIFKLGAHPAVEEVMALGTVLAFKFNDNCKGYGSSSAQTWLQPLQYPTLTTNLPFEVHYRTLGNVAYFMCSLNTPSQTLRSLEEAILKVLEQDK